ncbi:MAG: aconitase/3-isopropylmalate dehydratase large subunit family protein [Negativicutes bacterium]|nr:aconitase/3-isopropylmalate dehydratase large subunit family protein [Negativicutes bacterium]
MGRTIVEKILSIHSNTDALAGDVVIADIDFVMMHDINGPQVVDCFRELKTELKLSPRNVAVVLDHFAPCPIFSAANLHKKLRQFAKEFGTVLYEPGEGICHQLLVEKGHIYPGMLAVGTDSHTLAYGALNAVGVAMGASEAAVILASKRCWLKVPETVKINLTGRMSSLVSAKDIALHLIGLLTEQGAIYQCIEFGGEALKDLSIESRLVLCIMMAEIGAKTAVMPGDDVLARWLTGRGMGEFAFVQSDADASYARVIDIDISILGPKVSCHPNIDHVVDVAALRDKKVDQIIIGCCTNGRMEDFRAAATILQGRVIHPDTRLIVVPASRIILEELVASGILSIFIKAGAVIYPPGCGPCAGLHGGLVGDGEVVLSTTNRNMRGRMGSNKAEIYISSPNVAAFTALTGKINAAFVGGDSQHDISR